MIARTLFTALLAAITFSSVASADPEVLTPEEALVSYCLDTELSEYSGQCMPGSPNEGIIAPGICVIVEDADLPDEYEPFVYYADYCNMILSSGSN